MNRNRSSASPEQPGSADTCGKHTQQPLSLTPGPPPFSAMSDVVNDSFIPKLYPQQQDSECRMVDRLLLQLVTSPIFLIVSSFSLFAIIVKRARDQQQKNAWMEREFSVSAVSAIVPILPRVSAPASASVPTGDADVMWKNIE
jgi:hypothetical protein